MALFGPADRNLPFLTHAYQANLDDITEVRELAHRLREDIERDFIRNEVVKEEEKRPANFAMWFVPDGDWIDKHSDSQFAVFITLCRLIQSIMDTLEKDHSVLIGDIKAIERLTNDYPIEPAVVAKIDFYTEDYDRGGKLHDDTAIPVDALHAIIYQDTPNLWTFLFRRAWHIIFDLIREYIGEVKASSVGEPFNPPLRRCEECESVYQVRTQKDVLKYCSQRCANRAWMRKKRSAKKLESGVSKEGISLH